MLQDVLSRIKSEFQLPKFSLRCEEPYQFQFLLSNSKWPRLNPTKFWIIRLTILAYFIISLIIALLYSGERGRLSSWPVYMTSLNHIVVFIYVCSCAVMSSIQIWQTRAQSQPITNEPMITEVDSSSGESHHHTQQRSYGPLGRVMQIYAKFHWLLFNVSMSLCGFVVFAYWVFISHKDTDLQKGKDSTITYLTIDRHGVNFLLILLDFLLSSTPVNLLHFIYPSIFVAFYFIFNCIYWAITKTLIYGSILDYGNNTGVAVSMVFVAVFVAVPFGHMCWFLLFLLREILTRRRQNGTSCYSLGGIERPQV